MMPFTEGQSVVISVLMRSFGTPRSSGSGHNCAESQGLPVCLMGLLDHYFCLDKLEWKKLDNFYVSPNWEKKNKKSV